MQHLADNDLTLPYLNRVLIGGAAVPRMMIETLENKYDVEVIHGWGMTEMSPIGTTGKLKHATEHLQGEDRINLKLKQGRTPYLVEMKIVDDEHNDLPRDGKTSGHLLVRGPAVSSGYYKRDENILDEDGWFNTGDIANIDELGYMQITDRDKDVIKSGGEWISSIEIENTAVGCEGVAEAAVIGIAHPKWTERPLLIIVRKPGSEVRRKMYWPTSMARLQTGGCRKRLSLLMKYHIPRPVRSRKWNCVKSLAGISFKSHRRVVTVSTLLSDTGLQSAGPIPQRFHA